MSLAVSIRLMIGLLGPMAGLAACSAPPAPFPLTGRMLPAYHPSPRPLPASRPARRASCPPSEQVQLSAEQKAALFRQFDDWQKQRDAGGVAYAALDPSAPAHASAAGQACRQETP